MQTLKLLLFTHYLLYLYILTIVFLFTHFQNTGCIYICKKLHARWFRSVPSLEVTISRPLKRGHVNSPSQKGHQELPGVSTQFGWTDGPLKSNWWMSVWSWRQGYLGSFELYGFALQCEGTSGFVWKGPDVWIGRSGGDWVWVYFELELDYLRMFTSRKLTWQWNIHHVKMYFLLNIGILQYHVSFQGCMKLYFWILSYVWKQDVWLHIAHNMFVIVVSTKVWKLCINLHVYIISFINFTSMQMFNWSFIWQPTLSLNKFHFLTTNPGWFWRESLWISLLT